MPQIQPIEDAFTVWRSSYKRLRLLEADLVTRSRSGEDPAVILNLYENVEALREQTSQLFQLAQTAGMARDIPLIRRTALTLETTPSEFEALQDT